MARIPGTLLATLFAGALSACLFHSTDDGDHDSLPIPPEDSGMVGLRVKSFFNLGQGREWKKVYGEGRLEAESLAYVHPPSSARLIALDSSSSIIEKILSPAENLCGDMNISLKVSAPSQTNLTSVYHMSITLIGGPDLRHTASYNFHHLIREIHLLHPRQWTRINLSMRTFNRTASFDCGKVGRVRLALTAGPIGADTLNLGQLSFYPSPLETASLLITEDDEWSTFEEYGIPALREHGFPATIYANAGLAGTGSKMTVERLKTLQDSGGWTIGNHLWLHDSITSLSDDSATSAIRHNADFLRENGFTGYPHFAYPYGLVDRAKDSVVRANCASARLTLGWPQGEPLPYSDPYRLRVLGFLTHQVTLEMAKSSIRQVVENRTAGMIGVHEIVPAGPLDGNKWLRSDWEELLAYIRTFVDDGRLRVYSLEDFLERYHPMKP